MTQSRRALSKVAPPSDESVTEFVLRKGRQFDGLAANFELRCWLYSLGLLRSVRRKTAEMALRASRDPSSQEAGAASVLDLCCGTGGVTRELQRLFRHVVGVDLSPKMLAVAQRRCPGVQFVCGEASSAPVSRGPFDACVMGLCLHEMPAALREDMLDKATDCLRPGGRIVISDYAWPRSKWLRAVFARLGPVLIEPDVIEFLDWPLDELMLARGLNRVDDRRLYGGILRLSAWASGTGKSP